MSSALRFLSHGGAMGRLFQAQDWATSPLGSPASWPASLRTLVGVILGCDQPMFLVWGGQRTLLYNDAYAEVLAQKHPALGQDFLSVWEEIRAELAPLVARAYAGAPSSMDDIRLIMHRKGYTEETHWSYSYTPVRDDAGAVAGFVCLCRETTAQVLESRRQRFLLHLDARLRPTQSARAALEAACEAIGRELGCIICTFSEIDWSTETINVSSEWRADDVPSALGQHRLAAWDAGRLAQLKSGRPEVVDDATMAPRNLGHALGCRSWLSVPLIRDGIVTAMISAGTSTPRRWTDAEIALATETAERVWQAAERIHAETALRANEARLRFLSQLDEQLRASPDAPGAMLVASTVLAQHLGTSRCAYADVDADNDSFTIRDDYTAPGVKSSAGVYSLDLFGPRAAADMRAGRTLVICDVMRELAAAEGRDMFQAIGISAIVCCPLVKDRRLVAMMAVHQDVPRAWHTEEIAIVEATVERCWAHIERVSAEARLRESEALARSQADELAAVYHAAPVGLCVLDRDLRYVRINERMAELNGLPAASHIGRTVHEMVPDLGEQALDAVRRVLEGEALHGIELVGTTPAQPGVVRTWRENWLPLHDAQGAVVGITVSAEEITGAKRAEAELRELNETLERRVADAIKERDRLFQLSGDLFAAAGFDGRLKAINPAWERLLGYNTSELLAQPFIELVHPDDRARARDVVANFRRGKRLMRFEQRLLRKDGGTAWIAWAVVAEGDRIYAYGRDITADKARQAELEAAQEALRQSQKMDAMGQLTGGVAHDFNNLLTPIVGSLDRLQRKGIGSEREQRLIAGALQSAERAKTLVQRLLAFARRQPLQPIAVDVAKLVNGMGDLVASTTGPQIKVVVDAAEDLPAAKADPNQLEMALLNLAVNARDAMPDGGTLRITAGADQVGAGHRTKLRPGTYVRLSVADTGVGMDEATRVRAIEPFFSTKGVGQGTGLGLSMVHGLASQLGGALTIHSQPGFGTNIELWLPVSRDAVEASDAEAGLRPASSDAGTALLVDDEDLVRMSAADMLADLGYTVVEASSGDEALSLVRNGLKPRVLVTDHLMPGLKGTDLARVVRQEDPEIRVLVISGYAETEGVAPDLPRLTKPFRIDDLAAKLAALEGSRRGRSGREAHGHRRLRPAALLTRACTNGRPARLTDMPTGPRSACRPEGVPKRSDILQTQRTL